MGFREDIAFAAEELIADNPVSFSHNGFTRTGRLVRTPNQIGPMLDAGYGSDREETLIVPRSQMGATTFANRDEVTIDSRDYIVDGVRDTEGAFWSVTLKLVA